MFEFSLGAVDGQARVGTLQTPRGPVQTPVFMPVGTHGAVKSVSPAELAAAGSQIVLSNTYHLYLRPGADIVEQLGGVHGLLGWQKPMLTDSGGFQVFSLGERGMKGTERKAMRRVAEEGITFFSHIDGSRHMIRPEDSIAVQQKLGADIVMAFDQPVYGLSGIAEAGEAMRRSMRWLERSAEQWQRGDTAKQALFGIVQGGIHHDLHRESAAFVAAMDLPGNAIGGLSVGEAKPAMWEALQSITGLLPEAKPRYFMGLGDPYDLIEATARGVDMYDCVAPSRLARHGVIWQPEGDEAVVRAFWQGDTDALTGGEVELRFVRVNLKNAAFVGDIRPLRPEGCGDALARTPYGAVHHYVRTNEMLGARILTLHNIELLHKITEHMRRAIGAGRFEALRSAIRP